MKFACLLVAALAAGPAVARNFGSINVDGVGEVYVVGPDWTSSNVQMENNGFRLNGGGRVYLAQKPDDGLNADTYWQTPLNEMHFSYQLDLSRVGCHCNAAAYFIDMPGPGAGEGGDWYCDANFVGGQGRLPEQRLLCGLQHVLPRGQVHHQHQPSLHRLPLPERTAGQHLDVPGW